jgi:pimeloyl-ACP methyl ester carboxylesterase
MRRVLLALVLLALTLGSARAEEAGALRSDPSLALRGGAEAAGALVWIHPFTRDPQAPEAPAWSRRLTEQGWDLWRFDRVGGPDPLAAGAERLAAGTAALRARGYRRIVLLGESRGAFIALVALRHPGLADGVVLAAPAAHGRSAERRPQALADFAAALDAASPDAPARLALFLFADDPWDPDPPRRAALFRATAERLGRPALVVEHPPAPAGHGGVQEPDFDTVFGACLVDFLDTRRAPPATCP